MPSHKNHAKAYEKGRIQARRRRQVWLSEAFCANKSGGRCSKKGQSVGWLGGLSRRAREHELHQNSPTPQDERDCFRYRKAG